MPTCGVVYVHSTPLAVCQHVEWAIARVLTAPVNLHWTAQPVDPGMRRSECSWSGRPGTGAELAAALVFLASPAGGYVTGQTLAVDGGVTIT